MAEQVEMVDTQTQALDMGAETVPAVDPVVGASAGTENTEAKPEKSTEEDVRIPKARFDEVNQRAKAAEAKLAELEKAQKEAEIATLKEQGKWQKLYEEKEAELAQERIASEQLRLSSLRKDIATKHGFGFLADRLRGETEEELTADLQALIANLPPPTVPPVDGAAGSGSREAETNGEMYTQAELESLSAKLRIPVRDLPKRRITVK